MAGLLVAGGSRHSWFYLPTTGNWTPQVHETRVGTLKGKVPFMAPEQLKNEQLDLRIDVYALGVVLYELVTGRKPYEANSEVAMIQAILFEPFMTCRWASRHCQRRCW